MDEALKLGNVQSDGWIKISSPYPDISRAFAELLDYSSVASITYVCCMDVRLTVYIQTNAMVCCMTFFHMDERCRTKLGLVYLQ